MATLEAKIAKTRSASKLEDYENEGCAVVAAWNLNDLITEIRAEVAHGRMAEHRRREPEVDLLLEHTVNISSGFPDDYLQKKTATRFFELAGDAARCMLAATKEFHPVMFRACLNDGWRCLGRAEEVAHGIERAHETSSNAGGKGTRETTRKLRAAMLEGTVRGTIEEIAEKNYMSPRNVSFIKAFVRRRQAD